VTDATTSSPIDGAMVQAVGAMTFTDFTDNTGFYQMTAAEDTYDVTASAFGYAASTVMNVDVFSGTTTVQDFALNPAAIYTVDGFVTDVNTGWPLYASIDIDGYPGDPIWTDPATGYYSIDLPEGYAFTFNVEAWLPGYIGESRAVGPLTGNQTEDFALDADPVTCVAPGYTQTWDFYEDFEGGLGAWTTSGLWNQEQESDTCGSLVAPFPSSDTSSYYGQDGVCTFDTGAANTGSLTMAAPVLLTGVNPFMQFYSFEETECGGNCSFDNRYVEISTDGGATWTNLGEGDTEQVWYIRSFDLTPYAGANALFRFRFDSVDSIANGYFGWMIDNIGIGEPDCLPPAAGGLVVGNVYDANTLDGMNNALVDTDEGEMTYSAPTPADPNVDDGFYTLFGTPGNHGMTASFPGYAPGAATVNILDGDAVEQDFFLDAGYLMAVPPDLHVTLDLGDTASEILTLDNLGMVDANFELVEIDHGFMPALRKFDLNLAPSDGNFPRGTYADSAGAAPIEASGEVATGAPTVPLGSIGFSPDAANLTFSSVDVDVPEVLTAIAAFAPADFPGAGELIGGSVYVLDGLNNLYEIDPNTGAVLNTTVVAPAPPGGETWSGMALDPTTGIVYASSTSIAGSSLFTIDVGTSTSTLIGAMPNQACNIGIAIDGAGDLYGYDICVDQLYSIDKGTGADTLIGSIGFDANFGQGMGWDQATDTLYMAAFNNGTFQPELRAVDRGSGNTTLVGVLGSTTPGVLVQLPMLGLPIGGGPDVPWLDETPKLGTVLADDSLDIQVDFDASVPEVDQPGDYYADLDVLNDTPYGKLTVPVTMTVVPPADWGKIEGTVTDACTYDPIEGATVNIGAIVVATDANGYYNRWLAEGTYNVTVVMPGYLLGSATVDVVAGETTVQDFSLVPNRPCIEPDPDAIEVWVLEGTAVYTYDGGLDLINNGALDNPFEILEIGDDYGTGYPPPPPPPPSLVAENPGAFMGRETVDSAAPSGAAGEPSAIALNSVPFAPTAVLYDNGPLVTHPGGGAGGLDASALQTGLGMGTYGFGHQFGLGYHIADDFIVDTDWTINEITFFAYQTGSGTASTITGVYLAIWDGMPGAVGSSIIWGDYTTNLLVNTAFSDIYRVLDTNLLDSNRPIMANTVDVGGLNLPAGTYWLDWMSDGSLASGPWAPPVSVLGSTGTGNGLQSLDGGVTWAAVTDVGGQDFPFIIEGLAEIPDVEWIWEEPITGTISGQSMENIGVWFTAQYSDTTWMPLGTYTTTLTILNDDPVVGTAEVPAVMHIAAPEPPDVSFEAEEVCLGVTTVFTNTSYPGFPPADTFEWDFGDGDTLTAGFEHVSHDYAAPGTYSVAVEACNVAGCDTFTADVVVKPLPDADFTYVVNGMDVTFTNASANADTYLWDFGDMMTSTLESPVHTYAAPGDYVVTLTAYDTVGGCGMDIATMTVSVTAADLAITKAASPAEATPGGAVAYTLVVTNNGPSDASNVQVVDTLPAGVTFVSASTGCTEAAGVVTCDVGDLASGDSATITIQVTAPTTLGMITNSAEVSADEYDPDMDNNTATVDVNVSYFMLYLPFIHK